MHRRISSFRVSLALLVLLSLLPALGIILYAGEQFREASAEEVRADALQTVHVASTEYQRLIDNAEQLLVTLSELDEIREPDPKTCSFFLKSLNQKFPQYADLAISNVEGNLLCRASHNTGLLTLAGTPWFQRAVESREFTVGDFQVSQATGKMVVVFAYPVRGSGGSVQEVIIAALDLSWLDSLITDSSLPDGSSLLLVDQNGSVLAIYPEPDEWIGQNLTDNELVRTMLQSDEGTTEASGFDGIDRLYAFRRLQGGLSSFGSVSIATGIPASVAYSQVNRLMNILFVGLGLITVVCMLAAWIGGNVFFIRRIKAIVQAARRLGAGDLTARTGQPYGRSELSELALSFDDMASSLEKQRAELVLASQDLLQSEEKFRTLTETSPAAIFIFQDDDFIYVNPATEQITGFSRQELMDRSVWSVTHPEKQEEYRINNRARMRGEPAPSRYEIRIVTKSGEERWLDYSAGVIEYNGKPACLGTGFDITERIRAEQSITRKLDELEVLYATARAGTEATNLDDLIAGITAIIGERLFPHSFGVILLDRKQNQITFHPSYHTHQAEVWEPRPVSQGIIGEVIRTGKPYIANDVSLVPFYVGGEPETRSEICAPVFVNGEIFGLINAESTENDAFTEEDLALLEAIADQMATAVEKIHLLESERSRRKEADILREVSTALTSSLDLTQVIDNILINLELVIPYDTISVMLLDREQLRIVAHRGTWIVGIESALFEINSADHIHQVIKTLHPHVIADTLNCPSWIPAWDSQETRSWMGVPLVVKDQVIGLINLEKNGANRYTVEESQIALAFANQAASAIENARLFSMEQSRTRELEVLSKVSEGVRIEQSRAGILTMVLDQIMEATQADGSAIALRSTTGTQGLFEQGRGVMSSLVGKKMDLALDSSECRVIVHAPDASPHNGENPAPPFPNALCKGLNIVDAPLIANGQIIGSLYVGKSTEFSEEVLRLVSAVCDIAANAVHRANLFEQTERNLRRLSILRTIDMAITASINIRLTLDILIEEMMVNLKVDAADVLLLNPSTRTLEWASGQGFHHLALSRYKTALPDPFSANHKPTAVRAVFDRRPIHVPDIHQVDPIRGPLLAQEGFVNAYIVPFTVKGQVKGVIEIFGRSPFDLEPDWLGFLEALAGQAAIAIDNAEMFNHLERSNQELALAYDATIEGWSQALDLRDQETEGHTQRVTELTLRLARAMNIRSDDLVHIQRGALLHDIGKMGIPDQILLKPGPLTEDEWKIMRQHPVYAHKLLSPIAFLQTSIDIPYCHHEKWDGTGYPRGLSRNEIPLSARIFAIVDVWDALCSDRPYRKAWSREDAIEYIRAQSGKHFDPEIVDVFLKLQG